MGKSQEALKIAFDSQNKLQIKPRVLGNGNLNLLRVNSARDSNKKTTFCGQKGSITRRSNDAGSKTQRNFTPMITSNADFQIGMTKLIDKISQYIDNMLKKVKQFKKELKRNRKHGKSKDKITIDREA